MQKNELQLSKSARVIDDGGGDSRLFEYLLADGITDISLLDISAEDVRENQSSTGLEND